MTRPCPAFSPLPWDAGICRCGTIAEAHPDPLPPDPRPSFDLGAEIQMQTAAHRLLNAALYSEPVRLPAGVGR